MKSYKQFVTEMFSLVPVVDITTTGTDVSIPEIKNELNRNIDIVLRQSFITVEEALQKISKILSMYALHIPQVDSNDIKSDSITLVVGTHSIKWDELTGKVAEEDTFPFRLTFSFKLVDGLYKCSAELK